MSYDNFEQMPDSVPSEHLWELRVHIDPSVLKPGENNQIDRIKKILRDVFNGEAVGLKIFHISDDNEMYDGALSHSGKDRTQVGKEVGIYLPDSAVSQLTPAQYKNKLLLLWKKLQENNIPLMYMNLPGDQSITVATNIPSPFSFTSINPTIEEWREKHGILFKKFVPHGKHPILEVDFSFGDLNEHSIKLDQEELQRTTDFLANHKSAVYQDIQQQIDLIRSQPVSYEDILFNDEKSTELLKGLVNKYHHDVESIELTKQGAAQLQFKKHLNLHAEYQLLIEACPHDSNKEFISRMPPIKFNNFTEENAIQIITNLRTEFAQTVNDIRQDFLTLDGDLPFNPEELTDLIKKNPSKMQSIYRQLALIKQEESFNKESNPTIALLTAYKNNREQITPKQYFSFFGKISRLFGAYSKKEKFDAVDELIKSIHDNNYKLDKRYLGPLKQGRLKSIIEKANINLDEYIDQSSALTKTKK